MILNVMKVRQIFNDKVDSINFKNAIVQSQLPFELAEFEKNIQEIIIEENFGEEYFGTSVIENYPNLEKIVVKRNSLRNIKSLKICNNEKLQFIEIDGGTIRYEGDKSYCDCPLEYVSNLIIESNSLLNILLFTPSQFRINYFGRFGLYGSTTHVFVE